MVERILERITAKGLNVSEFERRIGSSTGTFNGWRKRNSVPAKKLLLIAEVLGTTEAYLRGETDDPSANPTVVDPNDVRFALMSESQDLDDEQMADLLEYVRFKKSQKKQ